MMPQSAGYFRAQVSLCKHYAGDLVENHNDSNLNWDFSVCTVVTKMFDSRTCLYITGTILGITELFK